MKNVFVAVELNKIENHDVSIIQEIIDTENLKNIQEVKSFVNNHFRGAFGNAYIVEVDKNIQHILYEKHFQRFKRTNWKTLLQNSTTYFLDRYRR